MAMINYATKEIQFKIVYYGPALCGKTTNLQYIHGQSDPQRKGELVSLATASDRTLFFDFLPLNAMAIEGFRTKFQLYTVPGQVIYNATRKLVLRSVDGVVFVADGQWDKMAENVESFQNLQDNLNQYGISLEDIPYVVQYNKRDLPSCAPPRYLEYLLNNRKVRVPSFESVATTGTGVFSTLNAIARLLLHKFIREHEETKASSAKALVPAGGAASA